MNIPFLDLRLKDDVLKRELLAAVERVLDHGMFMLGPEVNELEEVIASYCQSEFAVGVGSGSDALYLALRALDIGPGDEVITTPMTWVASVNAIVLCGATPRFVDIREDMNIDESLIPDAITSRTRAILPVHWHGKLCQVDEICRLAGEHGLSVVEDAAQAIGAERDGRRAGSFGHVNCLSMNAMKVWGAYGEAGAVITNDASLDTKLQSLRYAGTINKEDCHYPSLNARIDTMQAAMLLVNFQRLQQRIERRREIAAFFTEALCQDVECPQVASDHVFYTYTILVDQRDRLAEYLESKGISVRIRHPLLVTQQKAFRELPADVPVAQRLVDRVLSIPNHQDLNQQEMEYIVSCINEFYGVR